MQNSCGMLPLGSARNQTAPKLQGSVLLQKTSNMKCLKICTRIILLLVLVSLLLLGELVQGMNSDKSVSKHSADMNRDRTSSRDEIFRQTVASASVNSEICPKDHKIREREARDAEGPRGKRRREKDDDLPFGASLSAISGCKSCSRDKIRARFLETIKTSILTKLGMSHPPNMTECPRQRMGDDLVRLLQRRRHAHHGSNGLYWIVEDDDMDEMQGDEPHDFRSSDKNSGKSSDYSSKSYFQRSQSDNSDNKYSDSSEFQEGEFTTEEEDDYHVRTERIVAFAQPHPKVRHLPNILYFEFSDRLRSSKVRRALLWIYVKGLPRDSQGPGGNKINISIHKIVENGKPGAGSARDVPLISSVRVEPSQSIPNGSGAWITLEYVQIKNLVSEWFRHPEHNLGIVVTVHDSNKTNVEVAGTSGNGTKFESSYASSSNSQKLQTEGKQQVSRHSFQVPFLEVFVTDNRKHRTKRMVGLNCKNSSNETRCCRYPLTIDFVEFGWDWVIAPTKYEAFYCAGDCPLAFLPQYPHTHVSHLAGSGPCCAPRKLSDLQMLYYDQDMNLIFGKIPAMKVDRCGCI